MELYKVAARPCPADTIAIAINDKKHAQHCGLVSTDSAGVARLYDFQFEDVLGVRALSGDYFWAKVRLELADEVHQISALLDLVVEQYQANPKMPYSFIHSSDGLDVTGALRSGVGLTCATFIVAVFDHMKMRIVDLTTWQPRPITDRRFQQRVMNIARESGQPAVATRLAVETPAFRLQPWELCGSATHNRYPVRFRQATKLAKTVAKMITRNRPRRAVVH